VSIRFKVILPYLVLTIFVAVIGIYVVTRLVTNSLTERLTNQLLEAGRVVSDGITRQEIKHVEIGRIVGFTSGVAEAMEQGDREAIKTLVIPSAGGLGAENLILVDLQGQELLYLIQQPDGTLMDLNTPTGASNSTIVERLLSNLNPEAPPLRGIGLNPVDGHYYYYTAMLVVLENRVVGGVVVGTSLNTLLPYLKSVCLADILIYNRNGEVIATTLGGSSLDTSSLISLTIPIPDYDQLVVEDQFVMGENFQLNERWYSLARGSLRVGNDRLGVFAVVLPMNYIIQPGISSRNTYTALFTAAMLAVILIGFGTSRLIIKPLSSLVNTSQAITKGDLGRRSGINSKDEIGILASSFDVMTANLQQRNAELERTSHILEQMDLTKVRFIEVSAHELRSPLTAAKAYAQMMAAKSQGNPELQPMTKSLVESIDRLIEIVNYMLDISRIDSNTLDVVPDMVFIKTLVDKVNKTFQTGLQERRLILLTSGLEVLPSIRADPDLIYKVFYHLIMNAIKFTPDGSTIRVYGRKVQEGTEAPEVEVVVEDTGIGIAAEYHELIFEKFFQTGEVMLHSSGKTKFKGGGPGLGLAIAKGIVLAHKGRIWVESPGCDEKTCPGSKFFVRLPLDGGKG
jgi:signal transduction histidine kinase